MLLFEMHTFKGHEGFFLKLTARTASYDQQRTASVLDGGNPPSRYKQEFLVYFPFPRHIYH